MPIANASFPKELGNLRRSYANKLPGYVGTLEILLSSLGDGNRGRYAAEDMIDRAHKLSGTAVLYGYSTLGRISRELEWELTEGEPLEFPLAEDRLAVIRGLLAKMKAEIPPPE